MTMPNTTPSGSQPEKKSPRGRLLLLGGVLLAVLLVAGAALLLSGSRWDLPSAFAKTMSALRGEDRTQPRIFAEELDRLLRDGDYTLGLTTGGLFLEADYSRDRRIVSGTVTGMDRELSYSIDDSKILFTLPGRPGYVYGLQRIQWSQLLESPVVSAILEEMGWDWNLDRDLFAPSDLETTLCHGTWEALCRSVEIRELGRQKLNGQRCQVYKLSWSADALAELVTELGSLGEFPGLQELIASLIPDLGPECKCYVNKDGYILGVEFTAGGSPCRFTLEGRENPWDAFTLTVGDTTVYTGGLERSGSALEFRLENESGILLFLSYDDADGSFALSTRDLPRPVTGRLWAGSTLELELSWETEAQGPWQLSLTMAPLGRDPAPLAEVYIGMDFADLARLLLDLGT